MLIRPLRPEDDRNDFSCGDPDYDGFLRKYAGQNQFKHYIGQTAVAVTDGVIAGNTTYTVGSIEFDELPPSTKAALPHYPLPILRLARVAVDRRFQHQGLGHELVRYAFTMAFALRDKYGCVGIVVDALPDKTGLYEELGFVPIDVLEGESGIRPQPVPMFLALADVAAAVTGS